MSDKRTGKNRRPKILSVGKARALGFVTAKHPKQQKRLAARLGAAGAL